MADVTELRCWPSCAEAIDWSQDNIIALASDERVELLFPNTVSFDRHQEVPQWQHVPLRVPLFSTEELPIKEPAPLSTYSIGEEISGSAPTAIAWSPPGLAKHRRCALATLTANLVLSIWSAEGQPQVESSWGRRLIINDALAEYFLKPPTEDFSHLTSELEEQIRLRTRIRTFAWASAFPTRDLNGSIGTRLSFGRYIIAVTNDDNQIALVVVESPTSTFNVDQCWNSTVLSHFSITPDPGSTFSEPCYFEDILKQQRHISQIAWSPWIVRGDCYHSVLVYATNEDVRARAITYKDNEIGFGDEIVYTNVEVRYHGPMKWCPNDDDGDNLQLALFGNSGLTFLKVSALDASIIAQITHDIDGRWDQISGVAWDIAEPSKPRLHFSSLHSTLHFPTAVLDASSNGLVKLSSPNWRDQIENHLVLFSVKNDLKGNGKAKVWGLTVSPLGDFIVACSSVHPSDMIEYGPPADRRATVAISTLRQYSQLRKGFPSKDVSAEGVLFTLKKLAENTVEDADQMPAFAEEMVEKLMLSFSPPQFPPGNEATSTPSSVGIDLEALIKLLKKEAFFNQHTLMDRYMILVSQACNATESKEVSKTLIAYRLALAVRNLPSALSQTSFSDEVLSQHRTLVSLIDELTTPASKNVEQSPVEEIARLDDTSNVDHNVTNDHHTDNTAFSVAISDICDFCSAPIPFQDLASAACLNGHRFPRCGLSFLAIQAPGITKYCGLCSTPFLNEEFVAAQEKERTQEEGISVMDDITGRQAEGASLEQGQLSLDGTNTFDAQGSVTIGGEEIGGAGVGGECNRVQDSHVRGGATEDADAGRQKKAPPVTLARILFQACDVCIYCGGKFVS